MSSENDSLPIKVTPSTRALGSPCGREDRKYIVAAIIGGALAASLLAGCQTYPAHKTAVPRQVRYVPKPLSAAQTVQMHAPDDNGTYWTYCTDCPEPTPKTFQSTNAAVPTAEQVSSDSVWPTEQTVSGSTPAKKVKKSSNAPLKKQ